jgi:hypothetical protein
VACEVRSSPGVLGEAFIGAEVEGSGRGRRRNGWRWSAASMALAVSALKGWGSREDGAGHRFEKRRAGGAVDSASLGMEESAGGIRAVAAASGGVRRRPEEEEARVGRLGQTEVAGRLGPAGRIRPGKWGRHGSPRGGEGRWAEIGWRPKGRGGGSIPAWRGKRLGACWAGPRWPGPVGPNWGMNRKIDFGLIGC